MIKIIQMKMKEYKIKGEWWLNRKKWNNKNISKAWETTNKRKWLNRTIK